MKTALIGASGIGGLITGIFFLLGLTADLHNTLSFATTVFGNHTPAEWTQIATDNLNGCLYSFTITIIVDGIIALIYGTRR